MKRTFTTHQTEVEAIAEMKSRRKRKYTITYSEHWHCYVCWFNV